jgi:hypothetical protein
MALESYGIVRMSANGQATLPVDLRKSFGIERQTLQLLAFADLESREIRLIEIQDADDLYETLAASNRAPKPG